MNENTFFSFLADFSDQISNIFRNYFHLNNTIILKLLVYLYNDFFTRQEQSDGRVGVHDDQALSGFVSGLTDELVLIG